MLFQYKQNIVWDKQKKMFKAGKSVDTILYKSYGVEFYPAGKTWEIGIDGGGVKDETGNPIPTSSGFADIVAIKGNVLILCVPNPHSNTYNRFIVVNYYKVAKGHTTK